jgi:hypothetical protein
MPSFLRRRGSDLKSMISDPTPLTPPRNRNDRPDRPSLGNEHEQDDYHDHAQFDEEFVEGVIDDEEDEFGQPRSLVRRCNWVRRPPLCGLLSVGFDISPRSFFELPRR